MSTEPRTGPVQCATCGVEYDASSLPRTCPICADERQYLPPDGVQRWVDPSESTATVGLVEREPGLWGLRVHDGVGIGQQAKVVVTDEGCVMVDVPAAITDDAVRAVRNLGPMRAIIPTHPHMFGLQSAWSEALGAPVYVSAADAEWLGVRPARLRAWEGELRPVRAVVATQPGGHFPGSSVVHWDGADGAGVLLSGDTIFANPDRSSVSFMRSYPNRIPLSGADALRIADHVARWGFERLYSNFELRIDAGADAVVQASARRHAAWTSGTFDHLTRPDGADRRRIGSATPLRIVHLVPDLRAAERFWVDGFGLEIEERKAATGGEPPLLMVGPPDAPWHLELVEEPDAVAPVGDEGLVALYLGEPADDARIARIEACGGRRVAAHNPYWDRNGVTLAAPSGHRVVLAGRTWP